MNVKLEGTEKLIANIKRALLTHKDTEVRKALTGSAKILVDAAKSNIEHSDTGLLKSSIKILPKWSKDPSGMYVGPRVKRRRRRSGEKGKILDAGPYYAHWVEYGTSAHNLGFKGKFVDVNGKKHPGSKPKPYMRPAFDTKGQEALNTAMNDIARMIENKV